MTDTTPEIKQKQLEIWMAKTPMERLRQTLEDNDALYALWANLKKNKPENVSHGTTPSVDISRQ